LFINLFTLTPVTRTDDADAAGSIREPNGENACAFLVGAEAVVPFFLFAVLQIFGNYTFSRFFAGFHSKLGSFME